MQPKLRFAIFVGIFVLLGAPAGAQQKGQYIPGQAGLNAGVLPDPGLSYVNMTLKYYADTLKNGAGNSLPLTEVQQAFETRTGRGFPTVLVTAPKFALFDVQQVPFGGPHWTWLKRLKNSVRNSRFILSSGPKRVFLKMAQSKLLMPFIRSVGSTRDSLPKP